MRSTNATFCSAMILALVLIVSITAQSGDSSQQKGEAKKSIRPETERRDDQQGAESIKIETALVTVPVVASDRNDLYIPDLREEEFTLYEDGVKQELVFFAAI